MRRQELRAARRTESRSADCVRVRVYGRESQDIDNLNKIKYYPRKVVL